MLIVRPRPYLGATVAIYGSLWARATGDTEFTTAPAGMRLLRVHRGHIGGKGAHLPDQSYQSTE
jgi:hypothetical protein